MVSLTNRITALASLGKILLEVGENQQQKEYSSGLVNKLEKAVIEVVNHNGWFIEDNVRYMLSSLGKNLSKSNIENWIEPYKNKLIGRASGKNIGVVMAGNIPLVGFDDFLSVLISGNKIIAKLSSDDRILLPIIADLLVEVEPGFKKMIHFTNTQLKNFYAIIATGSNNTSRYFDYYFGNYPNIIRKNRNSVAVITGEESDDDLRNLTNDIFMYYGLGCRNVSHIMLPKGYQLSELLETCSLNEKVNLNHKYFNNYEYNKAISLVNGTDHFDSGNLLFLEDDSYSSPVSVIHISYYSDINSVNELLKVNNAKIQCIVSISSDISNAIPPGTSQSPDLVDYADGINTLEFLTNL